MFSLLPSLFPIKMSTTDRKFTMSTVFYKASKLLVTDFIQGEEENHYGVHCQIAIRRTAEHLGIWFHCYSNKTSDWRIDAEFTFEVILSEKEVARTESACDFTDNRIRGFSNLVEWSKLNFENGDTLRVTCEVTLKSVVGIYKEPSRNFDEDTMRALSDVTFKVGNQHFYVSKYTLALRSSYFERMFLGRFEESRTSLIELHDVDPVDFQEYLEFIFLGSEISDYNVERMLRLADMYDTPMIIEKCAAHLVKKNKDSILSIKDKTRLGWKFNLEDVQDLPDDETAM